MRANGGWPGASRGQGRMMPGWAGGTARVPSGSINTWFKTQQMAYSPGFMLSSGRCGSQYLACRLNVKMSVKCLGQTVPGT